MQPYYGVRYAVCFRRDDSPVAADRATPVLRRCPLRVKHSHDRDARVHRALRCREDASDVKTRRRGGSKEGDCGEGRGLGRGSSGARIFMDLPGRVSGRGSPARIWRGISQGADLQRAGRDLQGGSRAMDLQGADRPGRGFRGNRARIRARISAWCIEVAAKTEICAIQRRRPPTGFRSRHALTRLAAADTYREGADDGTTGCVAGVAGGDIAAFTDDAAIRDDIQVAARSLAAPSGWRYMMRRHCRQADPARFQPYRAPRRNPRLQQQPFPDSSAFVGRVSAAANSLSLTPAGSALRSVTWRRRDGHDRCVGYDGWGDIA